MSILDGEGEDGVMSILQSLWNTLHDAQVWPPTPDHVCNEVTAAYNFTLIKISSLVCGYKLVASNFGEFKSNELISSTLKRVQKCITGPCASDECSDENVIQQMLTILKALENPVLHFKSLTVLGRLLLLVTSVCLYKSHVNGWCQEAVTCLLGYTEMAGVPVLKEQCHFHHGLLLTSPLPKDIKEKEIKTVVVEDVVCVFLVTFQQPVNNLVMEHEEWRWLFTAMECRNLMKDKQYPLAMKKLQSTLTKCVDSLHKCRLLCLFADCYFCMDCPQLSIQTYRDALHVDSSHYSILYQLSLLYQSIDLPELELESLNLCVMAALAEKRKGERLPIMYTDELIWATVPPVRPISHVMAKVRFAKRCLQLKRYTEAAEQYSSLIKMLQEEKTISQFENHETMQTLNIAEILVEAAEVLLITQQYQDCIRLCDNTQPSLSADDTVARNSQMINDPSTNITFSNSHLSDIFDLLNDSQTEDSNSPKSTLREKIVLQKCGNESATDLHLSFEKSRKRMRSGDPIAGESKNGMLDESETDDDILISRLLLCKADALVLSQGFIDDAVFCLQRSMDILIHQPSPPTPSKSNHPPNSKRLRVSSDGQSVCPQLEVTGSPIEFNHAWSKLLVDTALRMATASWKRKRFSSVINSCRIVEQLDTGSLDAVYVKMCMMSERNDLQREAIIEWLNKRGVTYLADRNCLEATIKSLQQASRISDQTDLNWWKFSESDYQSLDVKCLKVLLEIHDKE